MEKFPDGDLKKCSSTALDSVNGAVNFLHRDDGGRKGMKNETVIFYKSFQSLQ